MTVGKILLAVELVVRTLGPAGLGLGQSSERSPDAIRKEAAEPKPSAEKAKRIFAELRDLAFKGDETADMRCNDATVAMLIVYPFDLKSVDSLYNEVKNSSWLAESSPKLHYSFLEDYERIILAYGRFDDFWAIAPSVRKVAKANPELLLNWLVYEGVAAQSKAKVGLQDDITLKMDPLLEDSRISLPVRQLALAQYIAMKVMVTGLLTPYLEAWRQRAYQLAGNGKDDTATYLRLTAESIDEFAIPDDEMARMRDKVMKAHPRALSDDIDVIIRRQVAQRAYKIYQKFSADRKDILARFDNQTLSYVKVAQMDADVILGLHRNDESDPLYTGWVSEQELMKEALSCLTVLDDPTNRAKSSPEAVAALWMKYYRRIGDKPMMLKKYLSLQPTRPEYRLTLLPFLADFAPDVVRKDWPSGIEAFADSIGEVAKTSANDALDSLKEWSLYWDCFECLPKLGASAEFLDGYANATGIVKNVLNGGRGGTRARTDRNFGKVTLRDIQAKLSTQPMVVFVRFEVPDSDLGAATYAAFLLSAGHPIVYKDLGDAHEIDEAIRVWSGSLKGDVEPAPKVGPKVAGRDLYRRLLQPIFGQTPPKQFYVVPDSKIGAVSFASLVTPRSKWLVEESTITYLGAMRDLAVTKAPSNQRSECLYASKFSQYRRLPEPTLSERALSSLNSQANTRVAFSPLAARSLNRPQYLHVSTHGQYNSTLAKNPQTVALASYLIAPGKPTDTVVTAKDVATWNLEGTRLATLAACDAAHSDFLDGEGTGGLRRGLYLAGVRQVIASIRLVYPAAKNEAPGDRLLALVYRNLKLGRTAAESLRQAQWTLLRDPKTSSPFIWAGFICEGCP